jgi:hypothetical protein
VGGKPSKARIYSLTFRDRIKGKWKERKAIVGNPDPLEGRIVMAIVETYSHYYVIWAKGRGGDHMKIDRSDVPPGGVEEFEP